MKVVDIALFFIDFQYSIHTYFVLLRNCDLTVNVPTKRYEKLVKNNLKFKIWKYFLKRFVLQF